MLGLVPTAVVFLLLGAVAVWGFRTEWKFGNPFSPGASAEPGTEKGGGRETVVTPGPAGPPGGCPLNGTRIRLTSPEVAGRMGLQVAPVESRPLAATVVAPAELGYDETRLARLSARVPGTAVRVERQVGDPVKKGEVLALVDATAVGKAKADLLAAIAQLDLREKTVENLQATKGTVAGQRIQEAESAVREARVQVLAAQQVLVNLGLPVKAEEVRKLPPDEQARRVRLIGLPADYARALDEGTTSTNFIPVPAPLDGVVVDRGVVSGEVVDPAKVLFVVADLSRMWVTANVRNEDADRVAVGQRLAFTADGHPSEALTGPVVWTSTTIDPQTRTLRVRAEISNPAAHWRARTFGTARITLRAADTPVAVVHPDAVQREGDCRYVFVRLDETTFEVRAVRLGVRGEAGGPPAGVGGRKEDRVEVLDGVRPGERVVTTGSFILKAELLKDQLGDAD
ncbi:MAG: efflux RND transporter periplasmic adaptor subunit [Gemmataceae bacterium]|nr:efflux RND transporter periplasmic adaptor subunit [Gemmataceae bacterium]